MSKRFTDTEKWKDDWFLSLSNDCKIIWQYLLDNCTIAGIWKKGFKHLNIFCNTNISEEEFKEVFKDRCFDKGSFYFIPKYLKHQYPKGLNSRKPIITSVVNELLSYRSFNIFKIIRESLGDDYSINNELLKNDLSIIKVKGKGKSNKKKVKREDSKEGIDHKTEFEKLWSQYPRKKGDTQKLLEKFKQQIKTRNDLELITRALENYKKSKENTELKYIAHGSTWFNEEWRDWIDYREEPERQKKRASPGEPLQDEWSTVPVFGENEEVQA